MSSENLGFGDKINGNRIILSVIMAVTPETLQNFVQYCQQHIKGDEKSESQTFLTKFFQSFGPWAVDNPPKT